MSHRMRRVSAALAVVVSPLALMASTHPAGAAGTCATPTAVMASDNGDGSSATVTWTPAGTCAAFAIYAYAYPPGSPAGPIVSVHPSSDTIGGLSADNNYVFTVTGYDSTANAWTAWSGWSSWTLIHGAPPPGPNPYGDPNLVSMFDGTDLNGWTAGGVTGPMPGAWSVVNGVIHGNGIGRGWLYYNHFYGSFRWIFDVQQVPGTSSHNPTVLIWGSTAPDCPKTAPNPCDALQGIQFQAPTNGHWDYRIGHNNGGSGFTTVSTTHPPITAWSQCEILADMAAGTARMACCPLGTATTCKAYEILDFHDPTAGRVGPLALQVHNAGLHDEYKNLW